MKKFKNLPFLLMLLPLFFCTHGMVENIGFVDAEDAIMMFFKIFLGLILLFFFIYLITKNYTFSSIITFTIGSWYIFFGAIKDAFKGVKYIESYTFLLPSLILGTILIGIVLKKKILLQKKITMYLSLLMLIYCAIDVANIYLKRDLFSSPKKYDQHFINPLLVSSKPNVYLLLFDEYAGYKSLQDSFGFKNDEIYNYLIKQKFTFLPIFANYNMTQFCMSSTLNMDYIIKIDSAKSNLSNIQKRANEIQYASVFNVFKSMGYQINSYGMFDVYDQKSLETNSFILSHSQLLNHKILHFRMLKDLNHLLRVGKFSNNYFKKIYTNLYSKYNKRIEFEFLQKLNEKKVKPNFTYAHFLLPHSPILYDSLGNDVNIVESNQKLNLQEIKQYYLSYLKYTNTKITALTNSIVKLDPTAITIIMSDHGFRYWEKRFQFEPYNFNNFCAIRYPTSPIKLPKDSISSVNVFRLILNQYYNQKITYLQDSIAIKFFE